MTAEIGIITEAVGRREKRSIATLNLIRGCTRCDNLNERTRKTLIMSLQTTEAEAGILAMCCKKLGYVKPEVSRVVMLLIDDIIFNILVMLDEQDAKQLLTKVLNLMNMHVEIIQVHSKEMSLEDLAGDVEDMLSILTHVLDEEMEDLDVGKMCFYGLSTVVSIMNENILDVPNVNSSFFRYVAQLVTSHAGKLTLLPSDFCMKILHSIDMQRASYDTGSERKAMEAIRAVARTRVYDGVCKRKTMTKSKSKGTGNSNSAGKCSPLHVLDATPIAQQRSTVNQSTGSDELKRTGLAKTSIDFYGINFSLTRVTNFKRVRVHPRFYFLMLERIQFLFKLGLITNLASSPAAQITKIGGPKQPHETKRAHLPAKLTPMTFFFVSFALLFGYKPFFTCASLTHLLTSPSLIRVVEKRPQRLQHSITSVINCTFSQLVTMVVLPKDVSLPFPRSNGDSCAAVGSIGADLLEAMRLHNETITDAALKFEIPDHKPATYSSQILAAVRDAFDETELAEYVGILSIDEIRRDHKKKYKKSIETIRNHMFRSFPVLELTEGVWGFRRAVKIALTNKKNTITRRKKRRDNKGKGEKGKGGKGTGEKKKMMNTPNSSDGEHIGLEEREKVDGTEPRLGAVIRDHSENETDEDDDDNRGDHVGPSASGRNQGDEGEHDDDSDVIEGGSITPDHYKMTQVRHDAEDEEDEIRPAARANVPSGRIAPTKKRMRNIESSETGQPSHLAQPRKGKARKRTPEFPLGLR